MDRRYSHRHVSSDDEGRTTTTVVRRYKVTAPGIVTHHDTSHRRPKSNHRATADQPQTQLVSLSSSGGGPHPDIIAAAASSNMAMVYRKDWSRERHEREYIPSERNRVVVHGYDRSVARRRDQDYDEAYRDGYNGAVKHYHHQHYQDYDQEAAEEARRREDYERANRGHQNYRRHTTIRRQRGSSVGSTLSRNSDDDHHQKRYMAEGALAGAGITALLQRRDEFGDLPEHRGRKVLVGAALGAIGAEALRRAKSAHEGSRGSSDEDHGTLKKALGAGAAALAIAGTAQLIRNYREENDSESRSRSRSLSTGRRRSRSRLYRRQRDYRASGSSAQSDVEYNYSEDRYVAVLALVLAAAARIVQTVNIKGDVTLLKSQPELSRQLLLLEGHAADTIVAAAAAVAVAAKTLFTLALMKRKSVVVMRITGLPKLQRAPQRLLLLQDTFATALYLVLEVAAVFARVLRLPGLVLSAPAQPNSITRYGDAPDRVANPAIDLVRDRALAHALSPHLALHPALTSQAEAETGITAITAGPRMSGALASSDDEFVPDAPVGRPKALTDYEANPIPMPESMSFGYGKGDKAVPIRSIKPHKEMEEKLPFSMPQNDRPRRRDRSITRDPVAHRQFSQDSALEADVESDDECAKIVSAKRKKEPMNAQRLSNASTIWIQICTVKEDKSEALRKKAEAPTISSYNSSPKSSWSPLQQVSPDETPNASALALDQEPTTEASLGPSTTSRQSLPQTYKPYREPQSFSSKGQMDYFSPKSEASHERCSSSNATLGTKDDEGRGANSIPVPPYPVTPVTFGPMSPQSSRTLQELHAARPSDEASSHAESEIEELPPRFDRFGQLLAFDGQNHQDEYRYRGDNTASGKFDYISVPDSHVESMWSMMSSDPKVVDAIADNMESNENSHHGGVKGSVFSWMLGRSSQRKVRSFV
ncbi:hypothetical protein CFO_g2775 [Ceratocystis platani]|uniref:Uncharacterized protein n=1 Tax=Ceratocystis fimbriata f. sp. platani TaxID=88771 RepID=A0A0F8DFZ5_CERFI|nr:hypothetical protein CFO_g2775 [Ceratocystis platani]